MIADRSKLGVCQIPVRPVLLQGVAADAYPQHVNANSRGCTSQLRLYRVPGCDALPQIFQGHGIEGWTHPDANMFLVRTKSPLAAGLRHPWSPLPPVPSDCVDPGLLKPPPPMLPPSRVSGHRNRLLSSENGASGAPLARASSATQHARSTRRPFPSGESTAGRLRCSATRPTLIATSLRVGLRGRRRGVSRSRTTPPTTLDDPLAGAATVRNVPPSAPAPAVPCNSSPVALFALCSSFPPRSTGPRPTGVLLRPFLLSMTPPCDVKWSFVRAHASSTRFVYQSGPALSPSCASVKKSYILSFKPGGRQV